MSLWGNGTKGKEDKPKWLTGQYSPENCYITKKGWVYRWPDGHEEVIAAINYNHTAFNGSNVSSLAWVASNTYKNNAAQTVYVSFNEKVIVSGLAPTFAIVGGGTPTATYSAPTITGTVTTVTTSNVVTGSGTKFKTELKVGDYIYNASGAKVGFVASIQSDIVATLTANALAAITAAAYLKSENKLAFTFTPTATGAISIAATAFATNSANIKSFDDLSAIDTTSWTAAVNTKLGSKTIIA